MELARHLQANYIDPPNLTTDRQEFIRNPTTTPAEEGLRNLEIPDAMIATTRGTGLSTVHEGPVPSQQVPQPPASLESETVKYNLYHTLFNLDQVSDFEASKSNFAG